MTECSRCGDCCERIVYQGSWTRLEEWMAWAQEWREWAMYNLRDGEDCGMEEGQARNVADAEFILAHWTPVPEDVAELVPRFRCDMFDPETRLCTAHSGRPPICRDYPWYFEQPGQSHQRLPPRCSFWADVPLENRLGSGLRLLPVLTNA